MSKRFDVLIVGAGHAGAQVAIALRQRGFDGSIGLVSEEPELPYDRPPLSKEYLSGDKPWERLVFRSSDAWAERNVTLLLSHRVVEVDAVTRSVTTEAGNVFSYHSLVWATGGYARKLSCSGSDLAGVHTIRNRADVDRILLELPAAMNAVVIGGGYIGLEAAAVLKKMQKKVVLVEALDRVLARVAGEQISRFYEAEHRAQGVDVQLSAQVEYMSGTNGKVSDITLSDGRKLEADLVIVGVGVVPAVAPLLAAGAKGGNGVKVDRHCRTNLPDVFAVGDCAQHRNRYAAQAWVRLESVQNANDQAQVAAAAIVGDDVEYESVPWFWSNQYDLKLQTVGLLQGFDQCVLRGDPATRSFSVVYLRGGKVIALDCVNMVRDYTHGRLLVQHSTEADLTKIADTSLPLKALIGG